MNRASGVSVWSLRTTYPWNPRKIDPPKPTGTRVWRVYLRGGRSFTFGLWVEHDKEYAAAHAAQWGEVIDVEPVT